MINPLKKGAAKVYTLGRNQQRKMWRHDNHLLKLTGNQKLTYQEWKSLPSVQERIKDLVIG